MTLVDKLDVSLLLLRLSIAAAFLFAGYWCTSSKLAFDQIKHECECFFTSLSREESRQRMGGVAAIVGMVMIFGGGVSLLLGIEPRLGGLVVALFSLLGLRVHHVSHSVAMKAALAGDKMGEKAVAGLKGSAMKNWVVVAGGVAIFLLGGGKYGLGVDYTGKYLGW